MNDTTPVRGEVETLEEARQKAMEHIGHAIDKLQDADQPRIASQLEQLLAQLESNRGPHCDNTDCPGNSTQIFQVRVKDTFGGNIVTWCVDCICRDQDMIADKPTHP